MPGSLTPVGRRPLSRFRKVRGIELACHRDALAHRPAARPAPGIHAGILQRMQIVGGRSELRILEVKKSDPGDVLAFRKKQRFGEWKSRRTQVVGSLRTGDSASRHSALNASRAAPKGKGAPIWGRYQSRSNSASIRKAPTS